MVRERSDVKVTRRWVMLCPERRDQALQRIEANESENNSIADSKEKLSTVRSRLNDISSWMPLLSQNIALRANKGRALDPVVLPA